MKTASSFAGVEAVENLGGSNVGVDAGGHSWCSTRERWSW